MGRNLARNFARHGYTVALHNRTVGPYHDAMVAEFGARGHLRPGPDRRGVRRPPGAPAAPGHHGQRRRGHRRGDRRVRPAARARRHDHRRRQRALQGHPPPRGRAARAGPALRRHGRLRRRGGRARTARRSCPAARRSPTSPSARCSRRSAAHVDGVPCCTHIGPDGAGHFVKMVHNGIEYADMQLIAEAYDLLRHAVGFEPGADRRGLPTWNTGPPRLLPHRDHRRGPRPHRREDRPALRGRRARPGRAEGHRPLDRAGRASTSACRSAASPRRSSPARCPATPTCAGRPPGAARPGPRTDGRRRRQRSPTRSSRPCTRRRSSSYAQGWNMIDAGSAEYDWDIDLGKMATIWRGGCIIRAAFLDRIRAAYAGNPRAAHPARRRRLRQGGRGRAGRLARRGRRPR